MNGTDAGITPRNFLVFFIEGTLQAKNSFQKVETDL